MTVQTDPARQPYPETIPVGMQRLHDFMMGYGGQNLGILAKPPRPVRGGSTPSLHNAGRAFDWRWIEASKDGSPAPEIEAAYNRGRGIIDYLIQHHDPLQIQRIHDYYRSKMWTPGRGWYAATPSSTTGMGQSWARWFHIERNLQGAADNRPIVQIAPNPPAGGGGGTTVPPVVPPPPPVVVTPPPTPPPVSEEDQIMAEIAAKFPELIRGMGTGGWTDVDWRIRQMQALLQVAGFYEGARVDAQFGINTERAVVSFQERNGLRADGKCGRNTWSKLLRVA